jgi:RNA polymerase sigma-70 factor (ECF subfamily)
MPAREPAANSSEDSEERLLVEAAQRDPARFSDLYERHFERIYAFIARRVRDRDVAEDLTSDVFQRALAGLRNYHWSGAPFTAWLFRIAANAVADQMKRAGRELLAGEEMPEGGDQPDLAQIEECARLFRFVDQLPADQRRVILERFVGEKSIREVAQQMEKSEGAVKQLQFRAFGNLRAQMEGRDA